MIGIEIDIFEDEASELISSVPLLIRLLLELRISNVFFFKGEFLFKRF